jgi:carboxypeptidase Taq
MNPTPEPALKRLKDRLATISDLRAASSLLFWDRQTYMPKGGVAGRAEQMATLSRLAHEMLVDVETGRLLDSLGEPDPSSEEGALIRRARRDYKRATKLPAELVAEITRATALAEPAWVKAREESDWSVFAPHLEKIVPLKKRAAEALGYEDHQIGRAHV